MNVYGGVVLLTVFIHLDDDDDEEEDDDDDPKSVISTNIVAMDVKKS